MDLLTQEGEKNKSEEAGLHVSAEEPREPVKRSEEKLEQPLITASTSD